MTRRIAVPASALVLASALAVTAGSGLAAWYWPHARRLSGQTSAPLATLTAPAQQATPPAGATLPVPPFPPRIADGRDYESCLAALNTDPAGAVAMAASLRPGNGATHCRGLALIALGQPDQGAAVLEQLAATSTAPALARAMVLGQAGQARLMAGQNQQAAADTTGALVLSPDDPGLLLLRAQAEAGLQHYPAAEADLTAALRIDGGRTEALVERAEVRRKMGHLDLAEADATTALTLHPDDAEALLERGILRQRLGDRDGARRDWVRAAGIDPDSTTADLAQQNLSLLEAGPPLR